MSTSQKDPRYIRYQDYGNVKDIFDRTVDIKHDEKHFERIIKDITKEKYKGYLENKTLIRLHQVLSKDPAFYGSITPYYCSYLNHWLNKEVQNPKNHVDETYFPIFQKFSEKFSYERTHKIDERCNNYIFNLGHETVNIMDILYGLYDEYDKIKSYSERGIYDPCYKLLSHAKNHNYGIDKYYEMGENLYNKFEYIKKLIDGLTMRRNSPCLEPIYLHKPKVIRLREEEEARNKAAEEEREREKALRTQREEALRTQREQQLKAQEVLLQSSENNRVAFTTSEKGISLSTGDQRGLRAPVISELDQNTQLLHSLENLQSSGGLLLEKVHTREGELIYTNGDTGPQEEGVYEQPGTDRTRSGMFGGSSGIPGYITEVFGSVDPVPVVGVSGGMGALFLLFRYTPLGTFFRGGRGRAHRIPRSFNGQFLGAFPDVNEYNGGYIGYGPMDIPYGAE
ncbi:PIR protein [Plasmodium vivax]|nr:PIR protein [Plasmodium vivax]